jgi:hypothetical protein
MKTLKNLICVLFITVILPYSCTEKEDLTQELLLDNYFELSKQTSTDLNFIAAQLRLEERTFKDARSFRNKVNELYKNETINDSFDKHLNQYVQYNNRSTRPSNSDGNDATITNLNSLEQPIKDLVENIIFEAQQHSKIEELDLYFSSTMNKIFLDETINSDNKNFVLTFIAIYKGTMDMVYENFDLLIENGKFGVSSFPFSRNLISTEYGIVDWFKRNAQCITAVIGGAITYGIEGCGVGAAVLGTLGGFAAGPPGAIVGIIQGCGYVGAIGALGGALVAGSDHCFE